jgi:hypothetical protein
MADEAALLEAKEKLVYEESLRAIDAQVRAAEGLRNRAGLVLTGASITTGFLGARALERRAELLKAHKITSTFDGPTWLAIISFCAVVALAAAVMVIRGWRSAHHPHRMREELLEKNPERPLTDLYWHFSWYYGAYFDRNARKLEVMYGLLVAAEVLLVVEVVSWLVVIGRAA